MRALALFALAVVVAGCTDRPDPVLDCLPPPFMATGNVTVQVGYGAVLVSNETRTVRLEVPSDLERDWCEAFP